MKYRNFGDTLPTEPARLATGLYSHHVARSDHIVNRALSWLLAVAIGAALAWWLWEWAGQCLAGASLCGAALIRPAPTRAANDARIEVAAQAAYQNGQDAGWRQGYVAGMRHSRVVHVLAGVLMGAALVAAALQLGLLAGAGA